jgi:uncharacterized protein
LVIYDRPMTVGTVTAIHLHPIKSCRRVEVTSATVSTTGLAGDREWQVASDLTPVTQRQQASLATVTPEPIEGGLRLSAPGRPTIEVARPTTNDTVTGSLIGVKVQVGDAGDEAAAWFSALLGDEVRLVARTDTSVLRIPESLDLFGQTIAFGDVAPVLVVNTASLRWLQERAVEPFGMDRFRPNLVVDTDEPFAEDTWARFQLGAAELAHGVIWPRCAIPQVNQTTGERGREPAVVLRAHRWADGPLDAVTEGWRPLVQNKGIFGVGCAIGPPGTVITVGDPLVVNETMAPVLAPPAG